MILLTLEDGTGRPDANVYDSVADCLAWLTNQGLEGFASATEEDRVKHLLVGTRKAESLARGKVEGEPVHPQQFLLFPREWCYLRDSRLLPLDERPLDYRRGIFLFAEADAKGELAESQDTGIASERVGDMRVVYREEKPIEDRHPEAWGLISNVMNAAAWGGY